VTSPGSSGPIIDVAAVLIVPDFKTFPAALESGVAKPLAGLESTTEAVIAAMEAQFAELAGELSAAFTEIAASADENFYGIAASVEGVSATIESEFASMGLEVDTIFDEIRNNAERDLAEVGASAAASSGVVSGAFSKAASVVALGAAGVGAGLVLMTAFGLKSAASLEQVNVALDALTGSVAAGNKQFADLKAFAAATPFEFNDLTTSAEKFDAFSAAIGQSKDQVTQYLTTIGDLVSETGGGAQALDSISLALGQTASQGKLTLGNLQQINNAIPGFNAVAAIAAVRGETTAQVMDELAKGTINANDGINELLIGMQKFPGAAGAMEKQSQTLLGVFSTFHDVVSQALAGAFAPAIPAIKDALNQLTPVIGQALDQLGPQLGGIVTSILPLIGDLVNGLVPIIMPVLDALSGALKALGPALVPLGNALGQIAGAIAPVIPFFATFIVAIVTALLPALNQLTPELSSLIPPIIKLLEALLPLLPVFAQLALIIVEVAIPLIGLIEFLGNHATVVDGLALGILAIVAGFKLYALWGAIVKGVTEAWAAVQLTLDAAMDANPIGIVVLAIAALVGIIIWAATKTQFFQTVWGGIWDFMKAVARWFSGPFVDFFKAIGAWFAGPFLVPFLAIGRFFSGPFLDPFRAIGHFFSVTLVGWVRTGVDYITGIPGKIKHAFAGAASWLYNAGRDVLHGLANGIQAALAGAIQTAKNAMHSIINSAKSALGISSPSKVFMEIGQNVVAGYTKGVNDNAPAASISTLSMLTPAGGSQRGGATAGSPLFGAGAIVINISGAVTSQEAYDTGTAVGQGISDVLAQRNVRNQVRTM
jgi:tape measure domain-containing protein